MNPTTACHSFATRTSFHESRCWQQGIAKMYCVLMPHARLEQIGFTKETRLHYLHTRPSPPKPSGDPRPEHQRRPAPRTPVRGDRLPWNAFRGESHPLQFQSRRDLHGEWGPNSSLKERRLRKRCVQYTVFALPNFAVPIIQSIASMKTFESGFSFALDRL